MKSTDFSILDKIADDPAKYAIRLFLGIIAFCAVLFLVACAPIKPCEKFSAIAVPDHGGNIWYAFDQSNVEKLASTLKGLSEGTCRIEK